MEMKPNEFMELHEDISVRKKMREDRYRTTLDSLKEEIKDLRVATDIFHEFYTRISSCHRLAQYKDVLNDMSGDMKRAIRLSEDLPF